MLWHLVDDISVNGIPHDTDPTFSGHDIEKSNEGRTHIIKVLVFVDPIATVIHTVKLINNLLLEVLWHVFHLTVEEIALVEVSTKNGEEKQEQDGDDHDITDVWNGVDQGHNGDSQTWVSRDDSQGSKHTSHSEYLEDTKVDVLEHDRNDGNADDGEIENVPCISHIGAWTVDNVSIHNVFDNQLHQEDCAYHIVDILKDISELTIRVHVWSFKSQQDCREGNQEQDDIIEVFVLDEVLASDSEGAVSCKEAKSSSLKFDDLLCLFLGLEGSLLLDGYHRESSRVLSVGQILLFHLLFTVLVG